MINIIDNFQLNKEAPLDSRTVVADSTARLALTWVYVGLTVYQVDTGDLYVYTGTPPSNTAPDWTVTLAAGTPGAPGSVWYNGSGVPSSGTGIVGDYYLDTASGDVYNKTGVSTWSLLTNIKGPTGASGTAAGAYGNILVTGGSTAQGLTSTDALITNWTADGGAVGTIPDYANDKITVNTAGDYLIYFSADVIGVTNKKYQLTVYVDGVATAVLGTFDCTSNATTTVSFAQVINIASGSVDLELYGKQISGGTENLTLVTATLGLAGINAKGDQGDPGIALIHTEHDIVLDDAKVTAVQLGSWTPVAPWSASVISDARSSLSVPAALTGNKVGHSIAYNGSAWIDNGVWRGPSGINGINGSNANIVVNAGTPSVGSSPEEIIVTSLSGNPTYYGIQTRPFTFLNAYGSNSNLLKAQYYCVATGFNIAMTLDTAYTGTVIYVNAMNYTGVITSTTGSFFYKGSTLSSLNLASLGIQSCILVAKDSSTNWAVVAEVNIAAAPVTSVNGLTGAVTIPVADLTDIVPASAVRQQTNALFSLVPGGVAGTYKEYGPYSWTATDYVVPFLSFNFAVQNPSGVDITGNVGIQFDGGAGYQTGRQYSFKVRGGSSAIYPGNITWAHNTAVSGTTYNYKLYIQFAAAPSTLYAPAVDYNIHPILRGGS